MVGGFVLHQTAQAARLHEDVVIVVVLGVDVAVAQQNHGNLRCPLLQPTPVCAAPKDAQLAIASRGCQYIHEQVRVELLYPLPVIHAPGAGDPRGVPGMADALRSYELLVRPVVLHALPFVFRVVRLPDGSACDVRVVLVHQQARISAVHACVGGVDTRLLFVDPCGRRNVSPRFHRGVLPRIQPHVSDGHEACVRRPHLVVLQSSDAHRRRLGESYLESSQRGLMHHLQRLVRLGLRVREDEGVEPFHVVEEGRLDRHVHLHAVLLQDWLHDFPYLRQGRLDACPRVRHVLPVSIAHIALFLVEGDHSALDDVPGVRKGDLEAPQVLLVSHHQAPQGRCRRGSIGAGGGLNSGGGGSGLAGGRVGTPPERACLPHRLINRRGLGYWLGGLGSSQLFSEGLQIHRAQYLRGRYSSPQSERTLLYALPHLDGPRNASRAAPALRHDGYGAPPRFRCLSRTSEVQKPRGVILRVKLAHRMPILQLPRASVLHRLHYTHYDTTPFYQHTQNAQEHHAARYLRPTLFQPERRLRVI